MGCGWQWVWEDSMAVATQEEMALPPPTPPWLGLLLFMKNLGDVAIYSLQGLRVLSPLSPLDSLVAGCIELKIVVII